MLTPDLLHDYQKKAVNFQCIHPHTAMWLDPGLGKTVITLTSVQYLISIDYLKAVLIVAPIRVCRLVWRQEAQKWAHTKGLRFNMVMGTKDQRTRALLREADIYLINNENLGWLSETLNTYFIDKDKPLPFDGVVWDEISKMKNSSTQRVKSVRKILPHLKWRTGLTGTPASNGLKDLHGQYLVLDEGERLGTSKTAFKHRFYKKDGPYKEIPYPDTEEAIKQLIGDITLEMSAEDYNKLPDMMVNDVNVELPDELRTMYERMERDFFIQLDSGAEIEVFNQAALTNKCLQFSNGAMYPVAGMPLWEPIHDLKLDALEEIIEENGGKPILCSYTYRSDAERIMTRFKDLRPINLTECKSESALNAAMARWKAGDCQLMIGHPACLGEDTQVLTERNGWVKIIDVKQSDRVFDGVEFVSHSGCSYSGYKEVIDVMDITMTPDHKLLFDGQWLEAKNVRDTKESRDEAIRLGEKASYYRLSQMYNVWSDNGDASSECHEKQQGEKEALSGMPAGYLSPHDEHSSIPNMVRDENSSERYNGQELRWSWDNGLSRMARKFREVLERYVGRVFGRFDNRKSGCQQTVQQRELSVGIQHGTTSQQTEQQDCCVSRRENSSCRVGSTVGRQQDHVSNPPQSRDEWRRSSTRCEKFQVRKESEYICNPTQRKAHVFDLVDCGPRHRFVIRNNKGEAFISHNSMGHGVDGLQAMGNTLVWYGLNWSLDLYDQFNARIRRQGQGHPVICHRILTLNTLDQAQALALNDKANTQTSLKNAIKSYRLMKEKS